MRVCNRCGKEFNRRRVIDGIKRDSGNRRVCWECLPPVVRHPVEIVSCNRCGKPTTNPKFCCKSCAASINNKIKPKRTRKLVYCKQCGVSIGSKRQLCDQCHYLGSRTIGETYRTGPDKYRRIRDHARTLYRSLLVQCEMCGWDKHAEVCHIKPISDFPPDTLVSVVNDRSNVAILCPNCHWVLDHLG